MTKPIVYIETTIPSAYHTGRKDAAMLAWRFATRRWWQVAAPFCRLVTGRAVLWELARGRSEHVARRLALLSGLPVLDPDEAVSATADVYVRQKLMPADPLGDALHLALASHHACDILLTWNYRHLANPSKLDRIRRVNRELGLSVPRILTPHDLLKGES